MLRREDLERLAPRPKDRDKAAVWDGYIDALTSPEGAKAMVIEGHITAPEKSEDPAAGNLRLAHFLATCAAETGGFTVLWESMSYRVERILEVFGEGRHSAAVKPAEAKRLAGNAYALAERVYGLGNPRKARELGNAEPGDGYRFRGLGIGQITGRARHELCADSLGCSVDDLALPINTLRAACVEWGEGRTNEMADRDDVIAVRKIWNGGQNGIDLVRSYLATAKKIWPVGEPTIKDMVELGDKGEHIKPIQQALADKGFPPGRIDGKFGLLTERMVSAFQVAHGLLGTGKVDQRTWELLQEKGDKPPPPAVPGREGLTAADLTKRGSATVKAGMLLGLWGRVLAFLGLTGTADALTGLGLFDLILTNAEKAVALAGRTSTLLGSLISGRMLLITGSVLAGAALMKVGAGIVTARVGEAQKGNTVR